MRAADIRQGEWIAVIDSKLTGKLASAWQDICVTVVEYQEAKDRLLKVCGYTPRLAADVFFGLKGEHSRGMTADQLYHRGLQLLRRMVAPNKASEEVEFSILRGWVGTVVSKRARAALDARVVENAADLINALQDHLVLEGDRTEGQAAIFKKGSGEGRKDRGSSLTCFKCGKAGHKAFECWAGKGGPSRAKPAVSISGSGPSKIVCYTCGEEGHKSPQCPKNLKGEKTGPKDFKPKPVKRIWRSQPSSVQLSGEVNGQEVMILLDSGAAISVVPESLVNLDQMTGCTVAVKPFGSKKPMLLPTAEISFKIGSLEWVETVAVAPWQEGVENEVLYSLDLQSQRGLELVLVANKVDQREVLKVTTRAQAKEEVHEQEEEAAVIAEEVPRVKSLPRGVTTGQEVINEPESAVALKELSIRAGCLGRKEEESEKDILGRMEEEIEEEFLVGEKDPSEESEEEKYELRSDSREEPELVVPPVRVGSHSRVALVKETMADPSLKNWRDYAEKGEQGFLWKEGLLYQTVITHVLETAHLIILPKSFRSKILGLAHEKLGHLGARKVKALLRQRFVWPGMGQDIIKYCRSCPICQKCKKAPARKVPMMEREVLTEPFEVMAFDIVGPMPKGKGGCRFLLTAICMASRWPEALPLRSITAKSVAQGMIEIFSRTGIPLQLLTDQGAQFVGSLVTQLCTNLHIDKIKTTPYHPEGNGVVERMHGTLGAMLTKAAAEGQDWVGQIPFALFALRSAPNRDSLFSPFQLVYGHQVRTPLDILHQGWAELEFKDLDTGEWSDWLAARLEHWHSVMGERGKNASEKRKLSFDRKTVDRKLEPGDQVLCRVPGMSHKLEEAWHGPYTVLEKVNRVDYRINLGKGRKKVLHINNLKQFYAREEEIMRLAVIAEDFDEDSDVGTRMRGKCADFDLEQLGKMKVEFPEVFSDLPGSQLREFHVQVEYVAGVHIAKGVPC